MLKKKTKEKSKKISGDFDGPSLPHVWRCEQGKGSNRYEIGERE